MNKIQKIWLAVCGSLFLVPEILWGLVQRVISQIGDDLFNLKFTQIFCLFKSLPDINIIRVSLMCQFIGVLSLFIISVKARNKFISLFLLLFTVLIVFAFVASLLFTLSNIG